MKLFAISDLHLSFAQGKPMDIFGSVWIDHWTEISEDWDSKVTDEDAVLIAGDISWAMKLPDAVGDLERISERKGKKIIIRGNHDYWWSSLKKMNEVLPPSVHCIQNDACKIGNAVICGSRGWSVPEIGDVQSDEDKKIFDREILRLEMSLKAASALQAEGDRLIVMIHFPPFNSRFADSAFTGLFERYGAETVVYGHLHGNSSRTRLYYEKNGIKYYLTSCDKLGNKLIQI